MRWKLRRVSMPFEAWAAAPRCPVFKYCGRQVEPAPGQCWVARRKMGAKLESSKVVIVIPARYGSTRLPGKPLVSLAGQPMIQRVYERAKRGKTAGRVIVATDHERM